MLIYNLFINKNLIKLSGINFTRIRLMTGITKSNNNIIFRTRVHWLNQDFFKEDVRQWYNTILAELLANNKSCTFLF